MQFYSIYNRGNAAKDALSNAEKQIGVPYLWGGTTPEGFDCSGLTLWANATVGITLPHWTGSQCKLFILPKGAKLQPGDLLYMEGSDGSATVPGHVVFYVSPGKILQAPFTGEDVGYAQYDTTKYMVATRPADYYPATPIKAPAPTDIYGAQVVELKDHAEATLAVKNGWGVLGWTGEGFASLGTNGDLVGVVKYANINYKKKRG